MSNKKYKIHIDRPEPSEQEVEKYKNFNRILFQYKRAKKRHSLHALLNRINKLIPILIIIIILFVFMIIFRAFQKEGNAPNGDKEKIEKVGPTPGKGAQQ